jgi:hypothetical protein
MSKRVGRMACAVLVAGAAMSGCATSERQRPIPTSRIPTAGNTLQDGRWTLVSLEYGSPEGKRAAISGTAGTLVADSFGNLEIEYRMSPEGLRVLEGLGFKAPNPVVSTRGRSVIDVDQKSITYVDDAAQPFDPKVAAGRGNPFALERTRYYDFGADGGLTLTTRHDDGKDAVVSRWRRG